MSGHHPWAQIKRKKKLVEIVQEEMFPANFHKNYMVVNHSYYIDKDGKSIWMSSQITWRTQ